MNGESGDIDHALTFDDRALVIDQNQIRDANPAEAHAERVDPEMIRPLRVARRDVSGRPFIEPVDREETKGRRQSLFAMQSFLFDAAEGRRRRQSEWFSRSDD